jgi:hypothetical protein
MTKHRKSRRSQKGGDWFGTSQNSSAYPQNSYSQNQYGQKKPWYDVSSWFSNSNQPYGQSSYSNPSSSYSSSSYPSSYYPSSSYPSSSYGQQQPYSNLPSGTGILGFGGKGRNRTLKMKGGKMSALSSAPVSGLKVVKPTYYLKNGGKRGKTQRHKKH